MLKGNRWFCIVTLPEVRRNPSSTLVEMKDRGGLCGIVGPGRGGAGGSQPLLRARACLGRTSAALEVDLQAPHGRSPVQSRAINSDYYRICVTYVSSYQVKKIDEVAKTVSYVRTYVHSKECTTGV